MAKIQNTSIFGVYQKNENRVTAAFLHLLQIGREQLISYLFSEKLENFPTSEITIDTQTANGRNIADGVISCGFTFRLKIESKLSGTIDEDQLKRYKEGLKPNEYLVYLVKTAPKQDVLNDTPYFTWSELSDKLNDYISDKKPSEIEKYLIEQFLLMLENLNLIDNHKTRVIVVAGSFGEKIAQEFGFYACQNHRFFKKAKYIAFYHSKRINTMYEIEEGYPQDDVRLRDQEIPEAFFEKYGSHYSDEVNNEFFRLKGENLLADRMISHEKINGNGRIGAFTQGQRYVTLGSILSAKNTDELVAAD